jgi:hypothetical protein
MQVEIRDIAVRAEISDEPARDLRHGFDPEAFRRELLEAVERRLDQALRRLRER